MSGRKYKFESRELAEKAYERKAREETLLMLALTDVLRQEVEWLSEKRGEPLIGVSRLDAPHGGIVVFMDDKMPAGAAYLDEWVAEVKQRPSPSMGDAESYRLWLHIQQVADEAKLRQREAMDDLMQRVVKSTK